MAPVYECGNLLVHRSCWALEESFCYCCCLLRAFGLSHTLCCTLCTFTTLYILPSAMTFTLPVLQCEQQLLYLARFASFAVITQVTALLCLCSTLCAAMTRQYLLMHYLRVTFACLFDRFYKSILRFNNSILKDLGVKR